MDPRIENRPYQRWSDSYISPGPVGSLGDALVTPMLKTSYIEQPPRFDKAFGVTDGTALQNGDDANYLHAGVGRCIDSNWDIRRPKRKYQNGWKSINVQSPDMMTEPYVSQLGDFSWRNQVARVTTTPYQMNPPGEYVPAGTPRGGAVPRITEIYADEDTYLPTNYVSGFGPRIK
jgi:hypothetical protein